MKIKPIAHTVLYDDFDDSEYRGDQLQGSCGAANVAEIAGRVCYRSEGKGRDSEGYHKNIIESNHLNVWRHPNWTFKIWNVSRSLSHELVRHHVGCSPSQESTRYVDESDYQMAPHPVLDDILDNTPELKEAHDKLHETIRDLYTKIVNRGVEMGYSRKEVRGAAARELPNGMETTLIWTMNGNSVVDIIKARLNHHADAEIRLLTQAVLDFYKAECPELVQGIENQSVDTE